MIIFKNNYVENEKLFSTGDSELDDILEEVYYSGIEDGYDYAQKEFGKTSWRYVKKAVKARTRYTANASEAAKKAVGTKKFNKKMEYLKDAEKELKKANDAQNRLFRATKNHPETLLALDRSRCGRVL